MWICKLHLVVFFPHSQKGPCCFTLTFYLLTELLALTNDAIVIVSS